MAETVSRARATVATAKAPNQSQAARSSAENSSTVEQGRHQHADGEDEHAGQAHPHLGPRPLAGQQQAADAVGQQRGRVQLGQDAGDGPRPPVGHGPRGQEQGRAQRRRRRPLGGQVAAGAVGELGPGARWWASAPRWRQISPRAITGYTA